MSDFKTKRPNKPSQYRHFKLYVIGKKKLDKNMAYILYGRYLEKLFSNLIFCLISQFLMELDI